MVAFLNTVLQTEPKTLLRTCPSELHIMIIAQETPRPFADQVVYGWAIITDH